MTLRYPVVPGADCVSESVVGVRFAETDMMGIVHHAKYLEYFELGRVDYLARRGVDYRALADSGVHMPVIEANLQYRKSARFGDVLRVTTTLSEMTRVTVRFDYIVRRGLEMLCEGSTCLACVGSELKPRRIPSEVAERLLEAGAAQATSVGCGRDRRALDADGSENDGDRDSGATPDASTRGTRAPDRRDPPLGCNSPGVGVGLGADGESACTRR